MLPAIIWGGIGMLGMLKGLSLFKPEIIEDGKAGAEELKKKGEQAFEDLCERINKNYEQKDKKK